jgi:hypothetical protein
MLSKISLSLAAALALFAASAARANPIPTSTDEARAVAGQVTAHEQIDARFAENDPVTSSDSARAAAGRSLPAFSGAWVAPTLARNTDEGRAAAFSDHQDLSAVATGPAVADPAERGN